MEAREWISVVAIAIGVLTVVVALHNKALERLSRHESDIARLEETKAQVEELRRVDEELKRELRPRLDLAHDRLVVLWYKHETEAGKVPQNK